MHIIHSFLSLLTRVSFFPVTPHHMHRGEGSSTCALCKFWYYAHFYVSRVHIVRCCQKSDFETTSAANFLKTRVLSNLREMPLRYFRSIKRSSSLALSSHTHHNWMPYLHSNWIRPPCGATLRRVLYNIHHAGYIKCITL